MKLLSDRTLKARGILTIAERRAKFPFTVAEITNMDGDIYILPDDGQSLESAVNAWQENAGVNGAEWRATVYLARTVYKQCSRCNTTCLEDAMQVYTEPPVYQSPWDDKPREGDTHHHCSEHCENKTREEVEGSDSDFAPYECETCQRLIVQRCPSNGWHEYFRITSDGMRVCLKCYQQVIEHDGVDRADIVAGKTPGTFFNRGELADKGWLKVGSYVLPGADMPRYQTESLAVIDAGGRVVIEYDRMTIGGLEGYITVWSKSKGMK